MKILCLLDSTLKPGDRWLWNYLDDCEDEVDFLTVSTSDRFPKWGKVLRYYPSYFGLAFRALNQTKVKDYDLIVAWEGKNGFPLALSRALLNIRKPKMVILSYSQRGIVTKFPWLSRFALHSVDHITVTSKGEVEQYTRMLGLVKGQVSWCPLGNYDVGQVRETSIYTDNPFIFSGGRSYRDYDTLSQALQGTNTRVIINARKFNTQKANFPPQVTVNDLMPLEEFWSLLVNCQFVIVPLLDVNHAAGDILIISAMAAGKAVIATRGISTTDYVDEGVTGLLVPPHDHEQLHRAIRLLEDNPDEAERMGRNARKQYEEKFTFNSFAERVHNQLLETVHDGQLQQHGT